jgi:hypothetical protein
MVVGTQGCKSLFRSPLLLAPCLYQTISFDTTPLDSTTKCPLSGGSALDGPVGSARVRQPISIWGPIYRLRQVLILLPMEASRDFLEAEFGGVSELICKVTLSWMRVRVHTWPIAVERRSSRSATLK